MWLWSIRLPICLSRIICIMSSSENSNPTIRNSYNYTNLQYRYITYTHTYIPLICSIPFPGLAVESDQTAYLPSSRPNNKVIIKRTHHWGFVRLCVYMCFITKKDGYLQFFSSNFSVIDTSIPTSKEIRILPSYSKILIIETNKYFQSLIFYNILSFLSLLL